MAETDHLVVGISYPERIAGPAELPGTEHLVTGVQLDTPDSLAGAGQYGDVVDGEVHQAGVSRNNKKCLAGGDQPGIDDAVAGVEPTITAAVAS